MAKKSQVRKTSVQRKKVNGGSLADQAYLAIKERIITLFFVPGQYLNEGAICESLEMGRTPVHQALQRLQVDGLVEVVPRKGVIIQPDSMKQVMDILHARLVVEPAIAAQAAINAKDSDIVELRKILDTHSISASSGSKIDSFVECDRAFHNKISEMCNSLLLTDFAKVLHERSTRAWYLHLWQTLDLKASDKQHRAVLSAIKARDSSAASSAMAVHLSSLLQKVELVQQHAPRRAAY